MRSLYLLLFYIITFILFPNINYRFDLCAAKLKRRPDTNVMMKANTEGLSLSLSDDSSEDSDYSGEIYMFTISINTCIYMFNKSQN